MYDNNTKNKVLQGAMRRAYTWILLSFPWASGLGAGRGCRRGLAESWV